MGGFRHDVGSDRKSLVHDSVSSFMNSSARKCSVAMAGNVSCAAQDPTEVHHQEAKLQADQNTKAEMLASRHIP